MLELDPYRPLPNPGETALIEIRPEVAVVGAGISGLIAARILAERGYPVTVLDRGRNYPGGRASTRYEGDFRFDHGCQYFTARDRRFQRYVEAWMEFGIASIWPARRAAIQNGVISPVEDEVIRYVGVPGMNAVARHLAKELDVRQAVVAEGITAVDGGWTIQSNANLSGIYEIVIIATQPNEAARIIGQHSSIRDVMTPVEMQPCWTTMVVFDYDLDLPFDAAHISGSPLIWAANNGSKPGRAGGEGWVLQASPSWSAEHIQHSPEQVALLMMQAFFSAINVTPVKPRHLGSHRWQAASPANPLKQGFLWDTERGLGACGDWCHSARMEGAFLSGLELAEKIMDDRPRSLIKRAR